MVCAVPAVAPVSPVTVKLARAFTSKLSLVAEIAVLVAPFSVRFPVSTSPVPAVSTVSAEYVATPLLVALELPLSVPVPVVSASGIVSTAAVKAVPLSVNVTVGAGLIAVFFTTVEGSCVKAMA